MERLVAAPGEALPKPGDGGRLIDDLDDLCNKLGCPADTPVQMDGPLPDWPPVAMPEPGEQELLDRVLAALRRVAASRTKNAGAGNGPVARGALDGALLTARVELLTGGIDRLRRILPSLLYLVVVPIAEQAEAQRIADVATRELRASARPSRTV